MERCWTCDRKREHRCHLCGRCPECHFHTLACPGEKKFREMVQALQAQHDAMDSLFAMLCGHVAGFRPSKSGQPWEALLQGNAALQIGNEVLAQVEKG